MAWYRRASTLAVVAWMALIFGLSSIPREVPSPGTHLVAPDKAAHFAVYSVLAFLLYAAGRPYVTTTRRAWLLVAASIAVAALYGVSDEFHQSFVPGRDPDPLDWLADLAGAVFGALVALVVVRRRVGKREV